MVDDMSAASEEEVLKELQRLLSSPAFEASDRNRRFLRHVVEETIAGRANRIKAYTIATGVFGRGVDFDPQQDSIVRIEAARLRRALDHCYLKEGETGRVRISIPKGSYVPEFEVRGQDRDVPAQLAEASDSPRPLHEFGPRILVENFDQEGEVERCPTIGRTLTRQVISALTRFTEIFVYGFDTTEEADRRSDGASGLAIDYCLSGTVTICKEALRAELLMRRAEDGRFVWAHSVERELGAEPDPSRIASLCGEIAGHVARVVALRDGVMDSQARDSAGEAPKHFAAYQKLLDFHDYWRSLDPRLFEPLRLDLEATISGDPHFAAAHACLSMLYSNAARYDYDVSSVFASPLDRALELARKAIHLAPSSSRAYHARAVAEWFSGMPEESLSTLQIARSLNPNDPELLAEIGFRSAMRMEWETAVPLLEEAYIRNPLQTGQYRMGLFLYHFAEGRYEKALQEAKAIDAPGVAYAHLAAAAALSELGRLDEAKDRLKKAESLAPGLRLKLNEDLAFRQVHPVLIAAITRAVGRIDPGSGLSVGKKRFVQL
jgi:tetratricopeptide (TPR) repeat protein